MSKRLVTPKFRACFAYVSQPNEDEKFTVTMLFDKAQDLSALEEIAEEAAKEEFGSLKGVNLPFKSGDEKADNSAEGKYEAFRGGTLLAASTKFQPGLVGPDRQPLLDESEFYSGCYARASVSPYTWEFKGKKGVGFNLNNVQKLADGEAFGSSRNAADDFETYEEEEEI